MKEASTQSTNFTSDKNFRRKKLLMGITLSELGGGQRVVYDLIANLPEKEFDITLVTSPGGELLQWINDLNNSSEPKIRIITLTSLKRKISLLDDLSTFFKLFGIICKGKYDIVHFHSSKMGILGRVAAYLARVPKIFYTTHGWGVKTVKSKFQFKVFDLLEKFAGKLSTKVICVSENDMYEGIKNGWVENGKVCVIHNGISEFHETKHELRKELNIRDNVPVVASIARLSPPKDPLFTISVANMVIRYGYDLMLLLIGDGPLRTDCEALIKDLGIGKNVLMLGLNPDVRSILWDVDIIVLFSEWEGLPITIIEAMFAGKPVIASNVGGVSELIQYGKNGYLLDTFDICQGAEYISKLIDDSKLSEMMGRTGSEMAHQGFTLDEMIRKYKEVYLE